MWFAKVQIHSMNLCCALKRKIHAIFIYYKLILLGLVVGALFFPSPDFTKSIIFGIVILIAVVPAFLSSSLLFLSFIGATLVPILFWKIK